MALMDFVPASIDLLAASAILSVICIFLIGCLFYNYFKNHIRLEKGLKIKLLFLMILFLIGNITIIITYYNPYFGNIFGRNWPIQPYQINQIFVIMVIQTLGLGILVWIFCLKNPRAMKDFFEEKEKMKEEDLKKR